jgi:hypothetical protein
MKAGVRILKLASHLVVMLWLGLYLAWPGLQASVEVPAAEPSARIQPRPEEPAQRPEPPDSAASEPEPPRPTRVSQAEISEGARLLDAAGRFPPLSSSYEDFPSFTDYARAMAALGARFVVVRERAIVGSIDPQTAAIGEPSIDRGFSPRARDYTGEPGLARLARAARERFGASAVVMMLVPREIDAGLFGGIARALSHRGESHDGLREIRARYERGPGGRVRLRVDSAVRMDGTRLGMDLLFDLSQIAQLAEGAPEPRA